MSVFRTFRYLLAVLVLCSLPLAASAGDHGGGAAPAPLQFTINLGQQYLRVDMVMESKHTEIQAAIAARKPKLQHEIILLLSGENPDTLRTLKGKEDLMERVRDAVNKAIGETTKSGVSEVLFTNFIIQ